MELRHLRYFLAAAREGNMTRAAVSCHVSQPALSRQLGDLERELGCELFVRESRGVTLTEEGMLLRKRAEEIVDLADRAELELRTDGAKIEGDVWVGAGESRVMDVVARAMARLGAEQPGVCLRLHSGNAEDVIERVDKGLLDFGVVIGHEVGRRFESLDLGWCDRWGVLMRQGHPLCERSSLTLEELAGERLIVSAQRHVDATDGGLFERVARQGISVVATYTLLYNASLLVERGVGVAICFGGIMAVGEGTPFAFVPLTDLPEVRAALVWKRFQPMSRAAQLFLRTIRDECAD